MSPMCPVQSVTYVSGRSSISCAVRGSTGKPPKTPINRNELQEGSRRVPASQWIAMAGAISRRRGAPLKAISTTFLVASRLLSSIARPYTFIVV